MAIKSVASGEGQYRAVARAVDGPSAWAVIGALTFLFYFSTRSALQMPDSLAYALSARTGQDLFHPHHLLYSPMVRAFYLALSPACDSCDAVLAAQVHNVLWASVAMAATFQVVKKLTGAGLAGLGAVLVLLVSQGPWVYATQAEIYVPALGVLALLTAIIVSAPGHELGWKRLLAVAVLLALAVLYHQSNALFAAPLGLYLAASQGRRRPWATLATLAVAGGIVALAYVLAFAAGPWEKTLASFVRFNLEYASHPNPTWGTLDNFSPGGAYYLFRSQMWNFIPIPFGAVTVPMFALALGALVAWNAARSLRPAPFRTLRGFLLAWLAAYFLFFLWWLPSEREFFIVTLFPIIVLGALVLRDVAMDGRHRRLRPLMAPAVAGVVTFLFATNLALTVLPAHQSRGHRYEEAARLAALAPAECLVVAEYPLAESLKYYFGRRAVQLDIPLLSIYERQPLPPEYLLSGEACLVVPLQGLSPSYEALEGISGYTRPGLWLRYLGWLLDFGPAGPEAPLSVRGPVAIRAETGATYLALGPGRVEVAGIQGLMALLDATASAPVASGRGQFQSWYEGAYSSRPAPVATLAP